MMSKYPSEIFGYYWKDNSKEASAVRQKHFCPFVGKECYKKSRLVSYPFGVCTAHVDEKDIALCPRRFLDRGTVFRDIAKAHFGTINNILIFSEVGLKGIGNFDFVMVKHKPLSNEVEDFAVIEFQTGQTTSTGKLVEGFADFMKSRTFSGASTYNFGINYYDIWKRTFTQVLNKGIILEKWNRKIFWVVQQPIFDYFLTKYRLGKLGYDKNHSSTFALYDLKPSGNTLPLKLTGMASSTVDDLFNAFRKNDEIPPVDEFMSRLQAKVNSEFNLGLRLDTKGGHSCLDVPRPTSSGRTKEDQAEYDSE